MLAIFLTPIIAPFADVFGRILAFFYSFTHSYGLSIILLTLVTMIVVFPLTRAGTRSMMRMQLLQPELLKIRNKYKAAPGSSSEERQANRLKLNEEMMALYRENGVNPTGGCLPMFLQFPIFIVLYDTIRGMTRTVTEGTGKHAHAVLSPQYIPKNSALYHAVRHAHGVLTFIGLNLTDSVRSPGNFAHKLPYIGVILVAVVLQYISIWQITNRNPSAQANPQMQAMQRFMPLIFAVIYIVLPAGVGVYFIVSSLFRIGQQEYMYKHDPKIVESVKEIRKRKALTAGKSAATPEKAKPSGTAPQKGFRERMRDAVAGFQGALPDPAPSVQPAKASGTGGSGTKGNTSSRNGATRPSGNGADPSKTSRNGQNRSRDKRPRRS